VPDIIRLSREINDGMALHAVSLLIKAMISKGATLKNGRILVEGFTFKENCPDTRNTKVVDLVRGLSEYGLTCDIHDDWANSAEVQEEYGVTLVDTIDPDVKYDAIILAVSHKQVLARGSTYYHDILSENGVFFDMKAAFPATDSDLRL
jgi:UDP-N-acetyl-D-galactosamine dehydrogenase